MRGRRLLARGPGRTRSGGRATPGVRTLAAALLAGLAWVPAGGGERARTPRPAQAQETPGDRAAPPAGLWGPGPGGPSLPGPEDLARLRARAEQEDRPRDWLALGAALLATGDWEGATAPLRRALESDAPEVREDAAYDLALAFAVSGRPEAGEGGPSGPAAGAEGPEAVRERLLQARDGFRAVLRSDPGAEDARWNLELVDRWLRRESRGGGGGGGQGGAGAGGGAEGGEARAAAMTDEEARRLLDAAAGAERAVQERRLERNRSRDPAAERNW